MPSLRVVDRVGVPPQVRAAIDSVVAEHTMLDKVVRWAYGGPEPRTLVDVVEQDEFTRDVVVRYDDELYLVYDCT